MRRQYRVLLLRMLIALGLLPGLVIAWAMTFASVVSVQINTVEVSHDDGLAYIVPFRRQANFLFHHQPDGVDRPNASQLILFENGKPLGPAHSSHVEIRRQGAGRFSHWDTAIWFSSSDGTDPRTNGRSYVAEGKLRVRPVWTFVGIAVFGMAMVLIANQAAANVNSRHWRPFASALGRFLDFLWRSRGFTAPVTILFSLIGVGVCIGAVIYGWYYGDTSTSGLEVARFFPVSDAFGYHRCATSISATGRSAQPFEDVWCARRALYPMMLASILSLTTWSSQLTLIVQGGLVGVAIATFTLTVSSSAGILAALLAAVLLSFYAWEFVLGLFMTEVLGLTLGLLGVTLLLGFGKSKHKLHLLAGTAFISVGLAARAGALLVLPALPIWAWLAFRRGEKAERARLFLIALLGALAGPLLQLAMLSLLNADAANTGGNFSATLYGLSTGSRDWSQAYRDFEPLFNQGETQAFQHIYQVAWENIKDSPGLFIEALWQAEQQYFVSLFSFVTVRDLNTPLTAFAALGAARCVFELQRTDARLIIALAIAEIAAAPLIIDSGGLRVFAVTAPVRILLCAIGAHWILQYIYRVIARGDVANNESQHAKPSWALATMTGAVVLILIILPGTPLAMMTRFQRVAGLGCPTGLREVVAHVGKESQVLTIVATSEAVDSIDPFRIAPGRLLQDSRLPRTWFGKDFLGLSPPFSIVRAVDLSSATASSVEPLAFAGELPDSVGLQSLCVDESAYVNIAGVRHHLIKQIRPISDQR